MIQWRGGSQYKIDDEVEFYVHNFLKLFLS